ncbi:D-alanine--D-alanine ligase [Maribellus sp. YY47]|uniref:D-alanine--D-alanine ligase n=1 Tax=Maribellus sp. YY47 TaxID=2929486 RepID=UPI0020013688|nr:D-alanine--D-alanine ligase [Maribellus sp. YY47]MCK3684655.1 D-alanine--D-alanine ligase [Maribellus sp. YY47]
MTNIFSKPNVAVVAGGNSSEFVVSVKSGANVMKAIDTQRFTPWLVEIQNDRWEVFQNNYKISDIDKSDFSFQFQGEKIKFDFAYITIHGTPGEDGILQAYFELMGVPYSSCNVHSSSLTFNKWFCSNYLRSMGIPMAKSLKFSVGDTIDPDFIIEKVGLPAFVKPNAGGSSFGITKVKSKEEVEAAIRKAWQESDEALVEQFIDGQEFTCGALKVKGEMTVFPITEVLPKNEFFDYEAKYTPGVTDEITPARLPEDLTQKCRELTAEIYDLCECDGIVRVDYILKDGLFHFLEVNTTPGMTGTSFVPQQIEAMGSSLQEILTKIIEAKLA